MVILRVSPGMANSMYEYATAYNLAKELDTELAIDVSEHDISIWPYMLDYFNIPEMRKVQYPVELSKRSHDTMEGIKNYFSDAPAILVSHSESISDKVIEYKNIADVQLGKIPSNKDLYLNDYFFAKEYNGKYWAEVIKQFEAREDFPEIRAFEQVAHDRGVVPVGIHIRRGDMLFASWAQKMNDEYYCAGIAWCRKHIKQCEFFVFTDDKKYAQELFGEQKDIHYVNVLGFDEADLIEFICLSKCEHFILSNSSTYSRLASEICKNENKTVILKKAISKVKWTSELSYRIKYLKTKYKNGKRRIEFSDSLINQYYKIYCTQIERYKTKPERMDIKEEISRQEPEGVLNTIACHSILNGFRSDIERVEILKAKMLALYEMKRFDRFVELSYVGYSYYADQEWFRKRLISSLMAEGYEGEAELERRWKRDRRTIVYIFGSNQGMIYSVNTMEMQYADIFGHMGFESHYVAKTDDNTSLAYIQKSKGKLFTNAAGIQSMYFAHDIDDFAQNGAALPENKDRIAIVRTSEDFGHAQGMKTIFVDYSDNNDYLYDIGQKLPKEELKWMYDNADYILSSDDNILKEYCEKSIKMQTIIPFIETRTHYRWGAFHRMKPEFIFNVSKIVEKLIL